MNIPGFFDSSNNEMQASFPLHVQGLKKSRKKISSAPLVLHACAHIVPPTGSALPLPANSFPTFKAPGKSCLLHASSQATLALTDTLPFGGSWRKSLLTARTGDVLLCTNAIPFQHSRMLFPQFSPLLHGQFPLFCRSHQPTNMLLFSHLRGKMFKTTF